MLRWLKRNTELVFWLAAITALYFLPETEGKPSLCVFSLLGFGNCPGCGIGHAIHDALHLKFMASVHHHIMGMPAVLIIFSRIKRLLYPSNKLNETQPHQPDTRHRG